MVRPDLHPCHGTEAGTDNRKNGSPYSRRQIKWDTSTACLLSAAMCNTMINREVRYKALVHYKHFDRSLRRVSKLYGVSKSSLQRWVQKDPSAQRCARRRQRILPSVKACIEGSIKANPFITMNQLAGVVQRQCGVNRSSSTMGRYRRACGITRKKAFRVVDAQHDLEKVLGFCRQHVAIGDELVCIDEAGFYVGEHGRYGYMSKGQRLNILAGRTMRRTKYTLLMAIAKSGVVHYKILDHNCKKADFITFISELPVAPGSALLMDNIQFHHSKDTVEAVRLKGCTQLFIPPYSPKFNAIENVFGTIKSRFRHQCPQAPSKDVNYRQIMVDLLNEFKFTDLSAYMDRATGHSRDALSAATSGGPAFFGYEL